MTWYNTHHRTWNEGWSSSRSSRGSPSDTHPCLSQLCPRGPHNMLIHVPQTIWKCMLPPTMSIKWPGHLTSLHKCHFLVTNHTCGQHFLMDTGSALTQPDWLQASPFISVSPHVFLADVEQLPSLISFLSYQFFHAINYAPQVSNHLILSHTCTPFGTILSTPTYRSTPYMHTSI